MCDGVGVCVGSPEKAMCKAVKVKPKLQWRPQDVGAVRDMEFLLRKAINTEWSQEREGMPTASGKAIVDRIAEAH
jgi:hypothetical protein